MEDIAIYGVGGFGREVLTLLKDINRTVLTYNIVGFFDDGYERGIQINGFPILGKMDDLNGWESDLGIVIAIGNPVVKRRVIDRITNSKVYFPTVIHPSVIIGESDYVVIGDGCIICASNIITTNIEIGNFVILNLACTVGHDTVIDNYSSFMPSVNISGEVKINENVYVGTGAKIINQLEIGRNSIIGAGAVVARSIPENCTAVGVPAKVIKYH